VEVFKEAGYTWGGDFKELNDAAHFEKTFGHSWKELYSKRELNDSYIIL
jgi:peptidoglycan L-alanyl-D-glutamate endopeptidase CwlK